MLSGIDDNALKNMTPEQLRWLNNIKRAVQQCDKAIVEQNIEDECLASLCRGIETAQKLRRSLQGTPTEKLKKDSRKHFVDFIELEFPTKIVAVYGESPGSNSLPHPPFSEMIYEVRCKAVHENENLNAADSLDSPVQVDWTLSNDMGGRTIDGMHFVNGRMLAIRLRGILAKFVMAIDSLRTGNLNVSIWPPVGSIRPD